MGLEVGLEQGRPPRKLKLLGLHGFRTSGDILRRQLSKWGSSLHELFDVDCIDAPLPCAGKSDVEGIFDPPYYEWFRINEDYTEYYLVDEMFSFVTDYMKLHGPYDGLLGFSQGAIISGCLAGLQQKGLALQDVPPIRFVVLISPGRLRDPRFKHVYEGDTIKCPTLSFLGDKDWLRRAGTEVLTSFENNITVKHRFGHTVPRLDESQTAIAVQFLKSQLGASNGADEAVPKDEVVASCLSLKVDDIGADIVPKANEHSEDVHVAA